MPPPFPRDIAALTGLRYLAAAWVVLFHYTHFTAVPGIEAIPVLGQGYLGVDFFFVLSGFILTHVYLPQIQRGAFNYWSFLVKRFARIYPMHLVTLAVFLLLAVLAQRGLLRADVWLGADALEPEQRNAAMRAFVAHLTLIHAWGATSQLWLNQPSWSISAEWFAYLLFPIFIVARRHLPGGDGARVVIVAAFFLLLALAIDKLLHTELTRLTWNVGILRIVPEFMLGMILYRFGETRSAGARLAPAGFAASGAAVVALLTVGATVAKTLAPACAALAVLGLAGLVFFAADAARYRALRFWSAPLPVYLGEISYSVYMVHLAVGLILFTGLFPMWRPADVPGALLVLITGIALSTLVAMASYRWIEIPCRRWLVARATVLTKPEAPHVS